MLALISKQRDTRISGAFLTDSRADSHGNDI